ncbi:MAG: hypothetical protein HOJ15_02020 [Candidatus Jacksonbacteria bacterium]|jgi:V/A-type H+/Na+-transporting ATPase subunit C|nr:hypothetical protein [Candidatus Jacksonbacteria bacterium]MBT6034341.1 hypothetical protein [Candidatus Jacksonbacteria bacterium]MBT6301181.1 hypothetical protein [Candidatus Jacksonbacteria bacterium]MBT6955259.1 hypothetical protein [Candidatus Jacksonbacteria bacterium]MBT7008345.1 hypothetical protein [Candidatus Jacksonbacteria bacterium]
MAYEYETGLIRVLEQRLVGSNEIERMLNAQTPQDALNVLYDTDLSDLVTEYKKPEEFEKILHSEENRLKTFFDKTALDPALKTMLYLEGDAYHLKHAVKKHFQEDISECRNAVFSLVSREELTKAWVLLKELHDNEEEAEPHITEAIPQPIKALVTTTLGLLTEESSDPRTIEHRVDYAYFGTLASTAAKSSSRFLKQFVAFKIDRVNVRYLLRTLRTKKPQECDLSFWLPAGEITKEEIELLAKEEASQPFTDRLIDLVHTKFISGKEQLELVTALKNYKDHNDLATLERDFENTEIAFIRQARREVYGTAVVFGYWYARLKAIENIHLIMAGKVNGLPGEEMRRRIRLPLTA